MNMGADASMSVESRLEVHSTELSVRKTSEVQHTVTAASCRSAKPDACYKVRDRKPTTVDKILLSTHNICI